MHKGIDSSQSAFYRINVSSVSVGELQPLQTFDRTSRPDKATDIVVCSSPKDVQEALPKKTRPAGDQDLQPALPSIRQRSLPGSTRRTRCGSLWTRFTYPSRVRLRTLRFRPLHARVFYQF